MMRGIEVEGEDALGAGGIAVDVEGDAQLQQQALGGVLVAQQAGRRTSDLNDVQDQLHVRAGTRPSASNISS